MSQTFQFFFTTTRFINTASDAAILADESSQEYLTKVAKIFGCDEKALLLSFTTKNIVTGKDSYVSPLDRAGAEIARDSLSMLLYETLFLW